MSDASQWRCPVDDCSWIHEEHHDINEPVRLLIPPGGSIEDAINDNVQERAQRRELLMREHLESHDVIDYARTIARLRHRIGMLGGPEEMAGNPTAAW